MDRDEVSQTNCLHRLVQCVAKYNTSGVGKLDSRYEQGMACDYVVAESGSINMCCKVIFEDGETWAVRFPMPGKVMHPEDKIRREVAAIRFMQEKSRIPVAKLVADGMALENHDPAMGPSSLRNESMAYRFRV